MDRPTILHGNINFLLKDYFPTNFFNRCIAMCEKVLQNCFFDFFDIFLNTTYIKVCIHRKCRNENLVLRKSL